MDTTLRVIARIRTEFPQKFGVPRQSGLAPTRAKIVFEPAYRQEESLRGIEGFSHLWLLWQFSEHAEKDWSPTVRPPRLGGNIRVGVFATRSPYRPNAIGLSSVRLEEVLPHTPEGPVLIVSGADCLDNTPIYDIKPYLAYTDSHPDATGGFALTSTEGPLRVVCPPTLWENIPPSRQQALCAVLAQDPRPAYQDDPTRLYGLWFAEFHVHFTVSGDVLTVVAVERKEATEAPVC